MGINVSVFIPDSTVTTMAGELADGSVQRAVNAAIAAYRPIDSDGEVPVLTYDEDFDNGVDVAMRYAETTEGNDLLVIVSNFKSNDRPKAERLLNTLPETGDFAVIVPCSNEGYDEAWADKLDNEGPGANHVDVVSVADLANHDIAYAEVGDWYNAI